MLTRVWGRTSVGDYGPGEKRLGKGGALINAVEYYIPPLEDEATCLDSCGVSDRAGL